MKHTIVPRTGIAAASVAALAIGIVPQVALAADAHVHGIAVMQVVVDDRAVRIDLRLPAHDILGFEHAPSNARERARAEAARRHLLQPWYRVPVAAGCRLGTARTVMPGDPTPSGQTQHDEHDHGGEGHDHGGEGHGDVTASHVLTCRAPAQLSALEVHLFDAYPSLVEVRVQYATAAAQGERRTTAGERRARLAND